MKITHIIFMVVIQAIQPIFAEENTVEKLIVTGTHIPGPLSPGCQPKVTITADEIKALAANSFAGIPGIDIIEQGGIGGLTFLSMRGGDPNFVVILIDGVKVNDLTNSRGWRF